MRVENLRTILVVAEAMMLVPHTGCGGTAIQPPPRDATWRVSVVRIDVDPTYACEGTVDTRAASAKFRCSAEQLPDWNIDGPVQPFIVENTLRLWIRSADSMADAQPAIAVDLESAGDHLEGWGTVVVPDGTGLGHVGAIAEAWLLMAPADTDVGVRALAGTFF